jgi:hypothetical protein
MRFDSKYIREGKQFMHGSYQIITRLDNKSDSDEILSILSDISAGRCKNDLKLVNYYQEMPIIYAVMEIDECRGGTLELTAHHNQAVVIAHQKQTILKSRHFPEGMSVHAIAENVSLKNGYVMLGRFAYVTVNAERRNAIRVKLKEKIPVTIKTDSAAFTGTLADISVSGVKVSDSGLPSDPGNAALEIAFPGERITLPGTFLRERISEQGHFHVFTVEPDAHAEAVISKLIYVRQVEIIQLLKDKLSLA